MGWRIPSGRSGCVIHPALRAAAISSETGFVQLRAAHCTDGLRLFHGLPSERLCEYSRIHECDPEQALAPVVAGFHLHLGDLLPAKVRQRRPRMTSNPPTRRLEIGKLQGTCWGF